MQRKTKYDILDQELKQASKNILSLVFSFLSLARKLNSSKATDEEKSLAVAKASKKLLPAVKVLSHLGYENAKDIKELDESIVNEYIAKKRLTREEFINNYNAKLTELVQMLTTLAIIEKEKINLSTVEDVNLLVDIFTGDADIDSIEEILKLPSSQDFIEEVYDDNFNVNHMSEELNELIETYHNNYMNTQIYPHVSSDEVTTKEILKTTKSLYKKSK